MVVGVFGAKFENDLNEFVQIIDNVFHSLNIKSDLSYFETTSENDKKKLRDINKRIERILYRSDALIIETTKKSTGMGIIIGMAINMRKPVLMLYNKELRQGQVSIIADAVSSSNRAFLTSYTDYNKSSLEMIVRDFLKKAKELTESKFNIILPPDITKYLAWYSDKQKVPKVDRLRELILNDMSKNKQWKDIIQED